MRRLLWAVLAGTAILCAQVNTLSKEDAAKGWILLFDGESLSGWTPEGGTTWKVVDGALVPDSGEHGWLRHNARFADFQLHCEFRAAVDANSGIYLRSASGGAPHLTGYELQIFDAHESYPTGSLVGYATATGASIKPNEWQSFDVVAAGQRLLVAMDGKMIVDTRDGKTASGSIGFQFCKGNKVAFRNIRLRPLGLKSLMDAASLAGWHKVDPPHAATVPAEWSIRDGILHVEKGPGRLESERTFANFILQFEARTNPKDASPHPDGSVFLRGTPNTWGSGYESKIRNKDGEFFTKTIVANGREFHVWTDGYPGPSVPDDRPQGLNAGTISLQARDATDLDFRNIRITELPAQR